LMSIFCMCTCKLTLECSHMHAYMWYQTQDDVTWFTHIMHLSFNVNTPLKNHCDTFSIGLLGFSTLNPMHDTLMWYHQLAW